MFGPLYGKHPVTTGEIEHRIPRLDYQMTLDGLDFI